MFKFLQKICVVALKSSKTVVETLYVIYLLFIITRQTELSCFQNYFYHVCKLSFVIFKKYKKDL